MNCDKNECFCDKCILEDDVQEMKQPEAKEVVQQSLPEYTGRREVIGVCMACFNSGCNGLCQTERGKQAIYWGNYDYCRKCD